MKVLWKLLYLVTIILLVLTDCRCQDQKIMVQSVLLEMPTLVSGFAQKIDREKFSDLVKSVIDKDQNYHFQADVEDGEVLRLSLILPADLRSTSSILLVASLGKTSEDNHSTKAFSDIAVQGGRISGNDVAASINNVLQSLYQLRKGLPNDRQEYVKKLELAANGDAIPTGELINAITIVTEMRDKKAEESLIKLLTNTESLSVGNACIVALGELKSSDAMPAIILFAERKPPILRRQAIIAARQIASKEAAEWLLVMAYGYDDPLVRTEAMAALIEVEKKLGINEEVD